MFVSKGAKVRGVREVLSESRTKNVCETGRLVQGFSFGRTFVLVHS
jgi:hypothetical protein